MDPQAALNELFAAVLEADVGSAQEYWETLVTWLRRGGFPPRDIAQAIKYAWDNH